MPLSTLSDWKRYGKVVNTKYTWIEIDLKSRDDDLRPESYSPKDSQFKDLIIGDHIDTKGNWYWRKKYCLQNVYTDLTSLINDSKAPKNRSLATFKPTKVRRLIIEKDERDWKPTWKALQKQMTLFNDKRDKPENIIPKVPYKFKYEFEDENGKVSKLMIEDWEIGQLYWNCLRRSGGNEEEALKKVRQRYEEEFINQKDLYLFLGTTKQWHQRRASNPFVIIGVFYPKKETQTKLF